MAALDLGTAQLDAIHNGAASPLTIDGGLVATTSTAAAATAQLGGSLRIAAAATPALSGQADPLRTSAGLSATVTPAFSASAIPGGKLQLAASGSATASGLAKEPASNCPLTANGNSQSDAASTISLRLQLAAAGSVFSLMRPAALTPAFEARTAAELSGSPALTTKIGLQAAATPAIAAAPTLKIAASFAASGSPAAAGAAAGLHVLAQLHAHKGDLPYGRPHLAAANTIGLAPAATLTITGPANVALEAHG